MKVYVSGLAGPWTVVSVEREPRMVLQGAALQPTYAIDQNPSSPTYDQKVFTPVKLTVFGYDVHYDGGTRMGGDTIVVCNTGRPRRSDEAVPRPVATPTGSPVPSRRSSSTATRRRTASGTAASRGTSRATSSGRSRSIRSTGSRIDENEDDEWVFPLADPFDVRRQRHHRRERPVRLVTCPAPATQPADRRLHRLRRRGQRPDHRQPGGRPSRRRLRRRHDPRPARRRPHLRRLRLQRRHPHARAHRHLRRTRARAPTLDKRNPAGDQTIKPVPSLNADAMDAGRDLIYGESPETTTSPLTAPSPASLPLRTRSATTLRTITTARSAARRSCSTTSSSATTASSYQQTADPNEPDPRLQKIQTTSHRVDPPDRVARLPERLRRRDLRQPRPRRHRRRRRQRHGRR